MKTGALVAIIFASAWFPRHSSALFATTPDLSGRWALAASTGVARFGSAFTIVQDATTLSLAREQTPSRPGPPGPDGLQMTMQVPGTTPSWVLNLDGTDSDVITRNVGPIAPKSPGELTANLVSTVSRGAWMASEFVVVTHTVYLVHLPGREGAFERMNTMQSTFTLPARDRLHIEGLAIEDPFPGSFSMPAPLISWSADYKRIN